MLLGHTGVTPHNDTKKTLPWEEGWHQDLHQMLAEILAWQFFSASFCQRLTSAVELLHQHSS